MSAPGNMETPGMVYARGDALSPRQIVSRCLIVASSFYEWQEVPWEKRRQPHVIGLASGEPPGANFNCRYNPSPTSFDGVEITYRVFSDGQAAHAFFPRWVIPVPPKPADMIVTPVQGRRR